MSPTLHLSLLAVAWILYGILHSLLASHAAKAWFRDRFSQAFRAYRLMFNLVAAVLLAPPLVLLFTYPGEPLWRWPGAAGWIADALAIAAIAGFILAFSIYDTGEFLGTRQWRMGSSHLDDQAPMRISWMHRFVRHPWYFLGLVVIWTREMNAALLVSAVLLTLYLWIGSRLEERKLLALYGEQYRIYRKRVPGLLPLPWRWLSRYEARAIASMRSAAGSSARRKGAASARR